MASEKTFLRNFQIFRRKKDEINHNFSVSKILNIGGSIRHTLRYSEKFRDIGIREFFDTIISAEPDRVFG